MPPEGAHDQQVERPQGPPVNQPWQARDEIEDGRKDDAAVEGCPELEPPAMGLAAAESFDMQLGCM
jgi:hypothetical protein